MEPYLRVGVISSTHGLKGEVKVYPTTDDPERFLDLDQVYLDIGGEYKTLGLEHVKFFKNQVILKFREFHDISEVEKYKGRDLLIAREQAVPLEENENYIADLIDMKVWTDQGRYLGVLTDVLETGANDVYAVETEEKKELLIPAIPACILEVNVEEKKMTVHLLEGLLE